MSSTQGIETPLRKKASNIGVLTNHDENYHDGVSHILSPTTPPTLGGIGSDNQVMSNT